jgi:hypothetical protein
MSKELQELDHEAQVQASANAAAASASSESSEFAIGGGAIAFRGGSIINPLGSDSRISTLTFSNASSNIRIDGHTISAGLLKIAVPTTLDFRGKSMIFCHEIEINEGSTLTALGGEIFGLSGLSYFYLSDSGKVCGENSDRTIIIPDVNEILLEKKDEITAAHQAAIEEDPSAKIIDLSVAALAQSVAELEHLRQLEIEARDAAEASLRSEAALEEARQEEALAIAARDAAEAALAALQVSEEVHAAEAAAADDSAVELSGASSSSAEAE